MPREQHSGDILKQINKQLINGVKGLNKWRLNFDWKSIDSYFGWSYKSTGHQLLTCMCQLKYYTMTLYGNLYRYLMEHMKASITLIRIIIKLI